MYTRCVPSRFPELLLIASNLIVRHTRVMFGRLILLFGLFGINCIFFNSNICKMYLFISSKFYEDHENLTAYSWLKQCSFIALSSL